MTEHKPTPACECKAWDPDWNCPVHGQARPAAAPKEPRKPRDQNPDRVVKRKTAG